LKKKETRAGRSCGIAEGGSGGKERGADGGAVEEEEEGVEVVGDCGLEEGFEQFWRSFWKKLKS
jgi:hypothetical protein